MVDYYSRDSAYSCDVPAWLYGYTLGNGFSAGHFRVMRNYLVSFLAALRENDCLSPSFDAHASLLLRDIDEACDAILRGYRATHETDNFRDFTFLFAGISNYDDIPRAK